MEGGLSRAIQTPLQIAAACSAVVRAERAIEGRVQGIMLGDVRAAAELARAAAVGRAGSRRPGHRPRLIGVRPAAGFLREWRT